MQVGKWNPVVFFVCRLLSHVLVGLVAYNFGMAPKGCVFLLIESSATDPCASRLGTVCCPTLLCFLDVQAGTCT